MIPETSKRQLDKLRKETKGKDIGDLTTKDRLNINTPNLQYIGNPVDNGIETYDEYIKKDNELQTIAFRSKLVNKPIIKNKEKIMEKHLENLLTMEDFEKSLEYHSPTYEPLPSKVPEELETYYLSKLHKKRYAEEPEYKKRYDEIEKQRKSKEVKEEEKEEKEEGKEKDKINRFAQFAEITESIAEPKKEKEEKQPEYTMLGKEKEPKSNPNFGYAAVRDQEIKKIGAFTEFTKMIDPPTPKERPVLNAGVFIDNDKVKGYVNRIEGKDVYVESIEEPMIIKKFSLKDAVKIKKEEK